MKDYRKSEIVKYIEGIISLFETAIRQLNEIKQAIENNDDFDRMYEIGTVLNNTSINFNIAQLVRVVARVSKENQ